MYIVIKLLKNNGEATGSEFGTPLLSDFAGRAVYDRLINLLKDGE